MCGICILFQIFLYLFFFRSVGEGSGLRFKRSGSQHKHLSSCKDRHLCHLFRRTLDPQVEFLYNELFFNWISMSLHVLCLMHSWLAFEAASVEVLPLQATPKLFADHVLHHLDFRRLDLLSTILQFSFLCFMTNLQVFDNLSCWKEGEILLNFPLSPRPPSQS